MLLDTTVAPDSDEVPWINPGIKPGETRKVMTGIPGKTALIYTLDRETGEFLWARPTVEQNVVADIDGGDRQGDRRSRFHSDRNGADAQHLPVHARRQGLGGGCVQSA